MKRIFYTLIFLLCFPVLCHSMSPAILGGAGGAGAASCGDLMIEQTGDTSSQQVNHNAANTFKSSGFVATASGEVRQVIVKIADYGTPPGDLKLYLCPASSTVPLSGTTMSNCVAASNSYTLPGGTAITAIYTYAAGVFAVTAGNYYAVVFNASGGDGSNYYTFRYYAESSGDAGGIDVSETGSTGTWNSAASGCQATMKVTSCTE